MSHKPEQELRQAIEAAGTGVEVGGTYYHYKHPDQLYIVTELAILEADDEVCVIYQAQYGEKVSFVRPLSSWLESVEVGGKSVARFHSVELGS